MAQVPPDTIKDIVDDPTCIGGARVRQAPANTAARRILLPDVFCANADERGEPLA